MTLSASSLRSLLNAVVAHRRGSLAALVGVLVIVLGTVWVAAQPGGPRPSPQAPAAQAPVPGQSTSSPRAPSGHPSTPAAGGSNPGVTASPGTPVPSPPPPSPSYSPSPSTLSMRVSGNHLMDGAGKTVVLRGVNLSGTEFACIQGGTPTSRGWSIYGGQPFDRASTYAAIVSWHANVVRVPLNEDCWLGISGVNPAYGGAAYRAAIQTEVSLIHQAGLYAVLDLHWTSPGPYAGYSQQPMPDADHSIAFWQSIAGTFKSDHSVIFDLFNEPFFYYISDGSDQWTCWLKGCAMNQFISAGQTAPDGSTTGYTTSYSWRTAGMQAMIDAVRDTGATQPVLVNGVDWGNDLSGWLAHQPSDPRGQLVAGWHSYPQQGCSPQSCWTSVIQPIAAKVPVLVGETGDNVQDPLSYVDTFLPWADSHGVSYLGWTWNPWQDPKNVLIKDWTGTPTTNWGTYYRNHLAAVAGP